jgi:hypothetical protein
MKLPCPCGRTLPEALAERARESGIRCKVDGVSFTPEQVAVFDREKAEDSIQDLFKRFAGELRNKGRRGYSSDMILHRIRWHYAVNQERDEGFKLNDHFTSRYARKLIQDDPLFDGFFETRKLRSKKVESEEI